MVVSSNGDLSGRNARLVETEAMLKTAGLSIDLAPEEVVRIMSGLDWSSHPTPDDVLRVARANYPGRF